MRNNHQTRFIRLKANLNRELEELQKLKAEADRLNADEAHPRIIGSILHDFYTGIERIFRQIAEELEGGLPNGAGWRRDLLNDMSLTLEGIRPSVIDEALKVKLDEYLRFRHLFRNVYGFQLDKVRLIGLVDGLGQVFEDFQRAIQEFNAFLTAIAAGTG
jgi:hypothetical protein